MERHCDAVVNIRIGDCRNYRRWEVSDFAPRLVFQSELFGGFVFGLLRVWHIYHHVRLRAFNYTNDPVTCFASSCIDIQIVAVYIGSTYTFAGYICKQRVIDVHCWISLKGSLTLAICFLTFQKDIARGALHIRYSIYRAVSRERNSYSLATEVHLETLKQKWIGEFLRVGKHNNGLVRMIACI